MSRLSVAHSTSTTPRDERVELFERAVVDVREVGALHLLVVGDETRLTLGDAAAARCADLRRRGDDDDGVEPLSPPVS